ncbi:hypothetical protein HGRIS_002103 [Hohenbuehelia grisea]|uniref:Uncharacterized protein n=1 Tax=Hohenbuehelia grisea TaxID=104357 RepID=A0ABR3JK58_9AGAR
MPTVFTSIKRKLTRKSHNRKSSVGSDDSHSDQSEPTSPVDFDGRHHPRHGNGWDQFVEETFAVPGCDCVFCVMRSQEPSVPRSLAHPHNMTQPHGGPRHYDESVIPPMASVFEVLYPNIPRPPPDYNSAQISRRASRPAASSLRTQVHVSRAHEAQGDFASNVEEDVPLSHLIRRSVDRVSDLPPYSRHDLNRHAMAMVST